jgi:hypothetical protein
MATLAFECLVNRYYLQEILYIDASTNSNAYLRMICSTRRTSTRRQTTSKHHQHVFAYMTFLLITLTREYSYPIFQFIRRSACLLAKLLYSS